MTIIVAKQRSLPSLSVASELYFPPLWKSQLGVWLSVSLKPLSSLHSMPFRALGLHAQILKAVQEAGYTEPTPIQAAAIPQILAGHDLIGIAQTGTGKTAAFVLPILTKLAGGISGGNRRRPRALVVAPTRELAAQIEENVRIYGKHLPLRAAVVFGGVNERPQIEALRVRSGPGSRHPWPAAGFDGAAAGRLFRAQLPRAR